MWVFLIVCHNYWRPYWPLLDRSRDAKPETDLLNGMLSHPKCPLGSTEEYLTCTHFFLVCLPGLWEWSSHWTTTHHSQASNINTQTSFFPFSHNLAIPLHVPKVVSYKSLQRMRVIPVSPCLCSFKICKSTTWHVIQYVLIEKRQALSPRPNIAGGCCLGWGTGTSVTANHQPSFIELLELTCLLAIWLQEKMEDIFCCLYNKRKWATEFFESYELRSPDPL